LFWGEGRKSSITGSKIPRVRKTEDRFYPLQREGKGNDVGEIKMERGVTKGKRRACKEKEGNQKEVPLVRKSIL